MGPNPSETSALMFTGEGKEPQGVATKPAPGDAGKSSGGGGGEEAPSALMLPHGTVLGPRGQTWAFPSSKQKADQSACCKLGLTTLNPSSPELEHKQPKQPRSLCGLDPWQRPVRAGPHSPAFVAATHQVLLLHTVR